ncbi:MAG: DUF1724 domain-containing protein [Candidatus Bathyarchaeota archaeon]|nr:DUF1724 domain-containing protein [Candidatus Bathyarchaeota archaeon]
MEYLAPLRSELKLKILLSLLSGEKKTAELKTEIAARETTILHVLKEFEAEKLTSKTAGTYRLTSLGTLSAQICKEVAESADVLKEFKEFWLLHDTSAIPLNLMSKIGALKGAYLIRTDTVELGKVYETYLQILMMSKKVVGISPIFHPDYVRAIAILLSQGNTVELILTTPVLNKIYSTVETADLKKAVESETLKIYLQENLNIALTVTEKNFSLGLFNLNGEYDDRMDLVSLSPQAIKWGKQLFLEYLKTSRSITSETMT